MPVAARNRMALIPDAIWKHLPDSVGGYISLLWLVLFWILRAVALWRSDLGTDSSPYRGLLCSGAAFCGVAALTTGGMTLFGLYHINGFGMILALLMGPIFLIAAPCSYMLYRAARDGWTPAPPPRTERPPL